MGKLTLALQEIPREDQAVYHGDPNAELVIVSWGSTRGDSGSHASAPEPGASHRVLEVRLLCPFPAELVAERVAGDGWRVTGDEWRRIHPLPPPPATRHPATATLPCLWTLR